jgi:hypothetical protein
VRVSDPGLSSFGKTGRLDGEHKPSTSPSGRQFRVVFDDDGPRRWLFAEALEVIAMPLVAYMARES